MRATSNVTGGGGPPVTISSTSPKPFVIASDGLDYYINPLGSDLSSGKSPGEAMKTLAALVDAYDLDAGDTIHVGAGNYRNYRNVMLAQSDSGVTIRGAGDGVSLFNRGNTNANQFVMQLAGADDVTIDRVHLTGAESGIAAPHGANSDRITISNSRIFGNRINGVNVGEQNDFYQLLDNVFYGIPGGVNTDDQDHGIFISSGSSTPTIGHVIAGNQIYDHRIIGIYDRAADITISNNSIFGNSIGIDAQAGTNHRHHIVSNSIRNNLNHGIYAFAAAFVGGMGITIEDNTVWGHTGPNARGITALNVLDVINNHVHSNSTGIYAENGTNPNLSSVSQNRVYNNSIVGIAAQSNVNLVGNYVYSNAVGIRGESVFYGRVHNNLIYANTNQGLLIRNSGSPSTATYTNNTIYQQVGEAVRLESSARNNRLVNNIIWVDAGFGVHVAANSQTGFESDYNLIFTGQAGAANTGFWNNTTQTSLAQWQSATGRDANSLAANPGFVDINGADNILGYAANVGGGIDGGGDDNFYRAKNSPTIDRGHTWLGTATDLEGFERLDDPGTVNIGTPTFNVAELGASEFNGSSGTAQNWRGQNTYWTLALPFSFPFYGTNYSSVFVSSSGLLQFGSASTWPGDANNSSAALSNAIRIAPLWDNLRTNGTGDDIHIDSSQADRRTIRWNATSVADNSDVQFAVTLFADGRIKFDYGPGNANLTPTVGISRGDGRFYELVAGYDGATSLTHANSVLFSLVAGFTDIGAYEFRGSSLDTQPPTIVSSLPLAVHQQGITAQPLESLELAFSEELNPIDANAPAAYELRGAGPDNQFDTGDDLLLQWRPEYIVGSNRVSLRPAAQGAPLTPGLYRVTVLGTLTSSLHDLSGLRFDGDADGIEGGNYVSVFRVISNQAPELMGANALPEIDWNIGEENNPGMLVSELVAQQITDIDGPGVGIAVTSANSAAGVWQYSLDGLVFQPFASTLVNGRAQLLAADENSRIRFIPNQDFHGTVNDLVFRAWDQADEYPEGTEILAAASEANSLSASIANALVEVIRRNRAPSDLLLDANSVNENRPAGTLVGLLSTQDPDIEDTHQLTFVSGEGDTDNGLFEIVGNELRTAASFDYETKASYTIRVRSTDPGEDYVERVFTIAVVDLPEMIGSPVFGDGTSQRSLVDRIVVTFDGDVVLDDDAILVSRRGAQGGPITTHYHKQVNGLGQTEVIVTFSGAGTRGTFNALVDGYYELTIVGTKITRGARELDIDGDGIGGDSLTLGDDPLHGYFARFGDTNGDGLITLAEFNQFRATFGKTPTAAGYNRALDFDGGGVTLSDFNQFRSRFGTPRLPWE
jgi:hypothetical protein